MGDHAFLCRDIERYWKARRHIRAHSRTKKARLRLNCGMTIPVQISIQLPIPQHELFARINQFAQVATAWVAGLYWSIPPRQIKLNIRLSPFAKQFCFHHHGYTAKLTSLKHLSICNINSGVSGLPLLWPEAKPDSQTQEHGNGNEENKWRRASIQVDVYRAQEWSLILIHELLHACAWDRLAPGSIPSDFLHNKMRAEMKDEPSSEGFVDAVAVWLHTHILFPDEKQRRIAWQQEQSWALARAVDLFSAGDWTTNTNVRAYFFLRAGLMAFPSWWHDTISWMRPVSTNKAQKSAHDVAVGWYALIQRACARITQYLQNNVQLDPRTPAHSGCITLRRTCHQLSFDAVSVMPV